MPEVRPPAMGPGRRAVFRPDHRSFGEFILSDQVRDATEEVAKDIAALAKEYAPRRGNTVPDGLSMADRFQVNRDAGVLKVAGNFRVMVEVYNEARSAAPNEFGGKRNARHRMLGRAGAMYGDFKPESGLADIAAAVVRSQKK